MHVHLYKRRYKYIDVNVYEYIYVNIYLNIDIYLCKNLQNYLNVVIFESWNYIS